MLLIHINLKAKRNCPHSFTLIFLDETAFRGKFFNHSGNIFPGRPVHVLVVPECESIPHHVISMHQVSNDPDVIKVYLGEEA